MTDINARFQLRKGTAALWASVNPILADGEPGLETDTGRLRMGNGVTQFASLPYYAQYADLDPDLTALGGLTTTGMVVRTGAGTAVTRSLAPGGANITITNASGVAGNPTVALTPGPLTEIGGLTPVRGDLLVRDATVMTRLPKGTAGQVLRMNAGGTDPEWGSLITAPGSAPLFACRAWVNFNGGDGAIRGSGNIASVVRNSSGDYTITFTTAMPDAAYAVVSQLSRNSGAGGATENLSIETMTASQVRLIATWSNPATGGTFDPTFCSVSIFR